MLEPRLRVQLPGIRYLVSRQLPDRDNACALLPDPKRRSGRVLMQPWCCLFGD